MITRVKRNDNRPIMDRHGNMWLRAEESAVAEIARSRARIRQLETAIRIFRKKVESGEPWPGNGIAGQDG
jgi:hypothetical protein